MKRNSDVTVVEDPSESVLLLLIDAEKVNDAPPLIIMLSNLVKSMIGRSISDLLEKQETNDLVSFPNTKNVNNPIVKEFKAGKGEIIINEYYYQDKKRNFLKNY